MKNIYTLRIYKKDLQEFMRLLQENNINGGYVEESFSENLGARKKD